MKPEINVISQEEVKNISTWELKNISTWELDSLYRIILAELQSRERELEQQIGIGSLVTFSLLDGSKVCHLIVDEYDEPGENFDEYYFKALRYYISPNGEIVTRSFVDLNRDYLSQSLKLTSPNVTVSKSRLEVDDYENLKKEFELALIEFTK